jgi:hypothetical protein
MKKLLTIFIFLLLFCLFIMSCSGNHGNLKTQPKGDSKVKQQELIDSWSDYNISYNSVVMVFDPKNNDKKIIVDNYWSTVKDQETWT